MSETSSCPLTPAQFAAKVEDLLWSERQKGNYPSPAIQVVSFTYKYPTLRISLKHKRKMLELKLNWKEIAASKTQDSWNSYTISAVTDVIGGMFSQSVYTWITPYIRPRSRN